MPYHPIAAFGVLYVIGLLALLVTLGLGGTIAPAAITWLVQSGYVNALPIAIVFVAARQSALMNGRPLFRFVAQNPKAIRHALRKHIWLWALSFGLAGVIADLAHVAIAATVHNQPIHYSLLRLLALAGIYCFIAREGIKSTFGPNVQLAAEPVSDAQAKAVPATSDSAPFDR